MATHASCNTSTGLNFENTISMVHNGINLTKYNLYKYLDSKKIDYKKLISKSFFLMGHILTPLRENSQFLKKSIRKPLVLLMKSLRLVLLNFISLRKLVKQLEQQK